MHARSENIVGSITDALIEKSCTALLYANRPEAALDVAAWLLIPGLAGQKVSLSIVYEDAGDRHEVLVDQGEVDSTHRILLANVALLPVIDRPRAVRVVLRSPLLKRGLVVESLYVKPIEALTVRHATAH
jgi:hypothetical protein